MCCCKLLGGDGGAPRFYIEIDLQHGSPGTHGFHVPATHCAPIGAVCSRESKPDYCEARAKFEDRTSGVTWSAHFPSLTLQGRTPNDRCQPPQPTTSYLIPVPSRAAGAVCPRARPPRPVHMYSSRPQGKERVGKRLPPPGRPRFGGLKSDLSA